MRHGRWRHPARMEILRPVASKDPPLLACLPAGRQNSQGRGTRKIKTRAPGSPSREAAFVRRGVPDAKMLGTRTISQPHTEVNSLSDSKQDESFR